MSSIFLPMIFPGFAEWQHWLPQIQRWIFQELLNRFLCEQFAYKAPNGHFRKNFVQNRIWSRDNFCGNQ
jgi:hypothetical protein